MDPENRKRRRGGARLQKTDPADQGKVSQKPSQATKRPKPKRTRKQKILLGLYIALTVIAALIVASFIFWNVFSAPPNPDNLATRKPQTTTIIDENGEEVEVEIPDLSTDRKEQFYTFLLVGRDTGGGGLTDTMMLGAYDVPNQKLSVMSIPRDTYVKYSGSTVLINSVYNRAGGGDKGIEALEEEVGKLTGVIPDYHVILEWEAVGELVDAIDGVWFEVPWDMNYDDPRQDLHIHVSKGYQLLNGEQAMSVARWRQNNDGSHSSKGDIGRIEIQQDFMKAVIEQCLQPNVLLPNLTEYIRIFQENVVTNLSVSNMAYFAKSAIGALDIESVEFITMPNKSAGDDHLLPIASEILEVVNESFNPYKDDILLSELDVVTSGPKSSGTGSKSTTAAATDTPKDEPDGSEGTDEPETDGEPPVSNEPGTANQPNGPGVTDQPSSPDATQEPETGEEPASSSDPEPAVPEDPDPAEEPEEPSIPPPPPEGAA